jgi:hypothetical protein
VAPAVDPVDVAGVLLAWQARYPHGNPAGGKLTIGEVAVSRVVHSVAGLSWKTPHAYCFSSMGCKAVMASEHDVEITTGVGAFEKSARFPKLLPPVNFPVIGVAKTVSSHITFSEKSRSLGFPFGSLG